MSVLVGSTIYWVFFSCAKADFSFFLYTADGDDWGIDFDFEPLENNWFSGWFNGGGDMFENLFDWW